MNLNHQIFTGIFADEFGQRFLRIASCATDNAFREISEKYGPSTRLKECFLKVNQWDTSIINEEYEKLHSEFMDVSNIFKQVYVNYVKVMRGGSQLKIMVNLPKLENFLKSFLTNISGNKFVTDGKYFDLGPLEQKTICMECLRDSLYEYLGDEYVKIEEKKKKFKPPPSIAEDDSYHSEEDSIIPEDSISSIGYHERKKNMDDDNRSSGSLSSISLSQVSKKEYKGSNRKDSRSEVSDSEKYDKKLRDDRSEISNQDNESINQEKNKNEKYKEEDKRFKQNDDENSEISLQESELSKRSCRDSSEKFKLRGERYPPTARSQSGMSHGSKLHNEKRSNMYRTRDDASNISDNSELSTNDRVKSYNKRRHRKHDDDESDVYSVQSQSKNKHREEHIKKDSERRHFSDDDSDDDMPKQRSASPCKSYVTKLTEDSAMTCER